MLCALFCSKLTEKKRRTEERLILAVGIDERARHEAPLSWKITWHHFSGTSVSGDGGAESGEEGEEEQKKMFPFLSRHVRLKLLSHRAKDLQKQVRITTCSKTFPPSP